MPTARRRYTITDSGAQQHAADVVHVDRHYDALAGVLAFRPVRV